MQTYLILLRGVMPIGKNKVPMAALREALTAAGLVDVRTYIQSGNVIARSDLAASDVEKLVHDEIEKQFGGDLAIMARTPEQVRAILENRPYQEADTAQVYFTILGSKPDAEKIEALLKLDFQPDQFTVTDEAVYVHCPDGYGRSKLNNNFLEKKLGVTATTRNYNTMRKLVELGEAIG